MQLSFLLALLPIFAAATSAAPLQARDNDGLKKICSGLKTRDNGCIRYVKGFDITGVVTEVDLTFPQIQNECDCIQACLDRPMTCNNYVYKFSTIASVQSGHRTCTLYSNFNLPPNVTIEYDVNSTNNVNIQLLQPGNNPQAGSLAPEAFKDMNLNTTADPDAVSGGLWALQDGTFVC